MLACDDLGVHRCRHLHRIEAIAAGVRLADILKVRSDAPARS